MPRHVVRSILTGFLVSRALIFLLLVLGSQISFLSHDYGGTIWRTEIRLSSARLAPELKRIVMVGDAWWYREISLHGYEAPQPGPPRSTWAFFPLFPLLTRALRPILDFPAAALLISNACFLGALFVLARVSLRLGAADETVDRMLWCVCFFPTSYFFSLPGTESLFLFLSALAFLLATEERWWAAGLTGGLAAVTRVVGVFLLPALLLLPLQRRGRLSPRQLWLLVIPTTLACFMAFLQFRTGDALAFVHVQQLWGRTGVAAWAPNGGFSGGIVVSRPWNFVLLNGVVAALLLTAAAALLKAREWAYGTYILLLVAAPLLSGSVQSIDRYALVAFPMFLWLARRTDDVRSERVVNATFVLLLGWLVALFTLRVDFALA